MEIRDRKFYSAEEMMEYLNAHHGLYSKHAGIYVWIYDTENSICTTSMNKIQAMEIANQAHLEEDFWSACLKDKEYQVWYDKKHKLYDANKLSNIEKCEELLSLQDWIHPDELLIRESNAEDFLCVRNDKIDNAFHQVLETLANTSLEWDMSIIGNLISCAENILEEKAIPYCHPFYNEGEDICYLSEERCPHCIRNDVTVSIIREAYINTCKYVYAIAKDIIKHKASPEVIKHAEEFARIENEYGEFWRINWGYAYCYVDISEDGRITNNIWFNNDEMGCQSSRLNDIISELKNMPDSKLIETSKYLDLGSDFEFYNTSKGLKYVELKEETIL